MPTNELFIVEYPDREIDDSQDMGGFTVLLDQPSAVEALDYSEEEDGAAVVRFVRDTELSALRDQVAMLREALENVKAVTNQLGPDRPSTQYMAESAHAIADAALAIPLPDAAREVEAWREKAELLDWVEQQIGNVYEGIETVRLHRDDATNSFIVAIGKDSLAGYGPTLLAALRAAKEKQ